MKRKFFLIGCIFLLLCVVLFTASFAITLLTSREALRLAFPRGSDIITEKKVLNPQQLSNIKARLGGKLHPELPKDAKITPTGKGDEYVFYFAHVRGKRKKAALILEEPGRWGPITLMVCLDLRGKVEDVIVLKYSETRGRSIVRKDFLTQFRDRTSQDTFELGEDIQAISGATISSQAVAFTVKKAIILYEELY